jgi:16S rRNA (cytosine1402-N4)-methyltransferase
VERNFHDPVLKESLLELLDPQPGGLYVDANLGGGSHSLALLERLQGQGHVIGIDLDLEAIHEASAKLHDHSNFSTLHGNFANLAELLAEQGITEIDGIIFDLGVSSHQLDTAERGFSFRHDGPLDMRMDPSLGESAADVVSTATERQLTQIIKELGEERWAAAIARKIVQQRTRGPLASTGQLADLVSSAVPRKFHPPTTHVATRTFQALRIYVNRELDNLSQGLEAAIGLLKPQGRVGCIAYHSLEDRIVKRTLLRMSGAPPERPQGLPMGLFPSAPPALIRILTRQALTPTEAEVARNPRARSAKLRGAVKLQPPMAC